MAAGCREFGRLTLTHMNEWVDGGDGGGLGLSPLPDADKRLRSYEIGPFTVGGGYLSFDFSEWEVRWLDSIERNYIYNESRNYIYNSSP